MPGNNVLIQNKETVKEYAHGHGMNVISVEGIPEGFAIEGPIRGHDGQTYPAMSEKYYAFVPDKVFPTAMVKADSLEELVEKFKKIHV